MNERRRQYGADLLERSRERALGCQHRPTIAVDTFAERSPSRRCDGPVESP